MMAKQGVKNNGVVRVYDVGTEANTDFCIQPRPTLRRQGRARDRRRPPFGHGDLSTRPRSSAPQLAQDLRLQHGDLEQCLGGARGLTATLVPILQRPHGDAEQVSGLPLRQSDARPRLSGGRDLDLRDAGSLTPARLLDGGQRVLLKRSRSEGKLDPSPELRKVLRRQVVELRPAFEQGAVGIPEEREPHAAHRFRIEELVQFGAAAPTPTTDQPKCGTWARAGG